MTRATLAFLLLASWLTPGCATDLQPMAKSHDELGWDAATVSGGLTRLPLNGDSRQAGLFSNRVVFPAGYAGPPHTHSVDLHALVIRGASNIVFSSQLDRRGANLVKASGYIYIPAGTVHYEWFDEETELHLYGVGPMETTLVEVAQ